MYPTLFYCPIACTIQIMATNPKNESISRVTSIFLTTKKLPKMVQLSIFCVDYYDYKCASLLWLIFNLFPQLFGFPKSWCNGYDLPSLLHIIHIVLLASFSHSVYKLFTGYKTRIWISIHWLTWSWNFKALSIFVWFMCQFVCRLVWNVVEIMCNYQEKMIPILDYSNCTMGCF